MSSSNDLEQFVNLVGSIRIDHYAYEEIQISVSEAFEDVGADPKAVNAAAVPICLLIVGDTRTGKSSVVKDFLDQTMPIRMQEGVRQAVVYAVAPPKATVKALLEQLLRALSDPHWSKGSESNMTHRLLTLLRGVGCRMIIIDEFQHLSDKGQKRLLVRSADWLKNLVEGKEWALVAVGLPESISVINANPQLTARFDPPMVMPRFDWNDDRLRKQFKAILRAFVAELRPFELPDLSSDEMAFRMYLATSGRVGLFVKLMDRAVKTAIRKGDPRIRTEDLAAAFKRSIWYASKFPLPGGPFHAELSSCQESALITKVIDMANSDAYADISGGVLIKQSEGKAEEQTRRTRSSKQRVKEDLERAL
jgi:Cdc6-like AAA superfamily ATPase